MEVLAKLNSPVMYLICGGIVVLVAVICMIFAVRAYRAGKAIGIDVGKMKRVIIASATFAVLPSVGILLGVIALSGSLGTPWPWLRLSVIGALHYETQVAEAAADFFNKIWHFHLYFDTRYSTMKEKSGGGYARLLYGGASSLGRRRNLLFGKGGGRAFLASFAV